MSQVVRIITRLNVGGPTRQALLLQPAMAERGFPTELVAGTEGRQEGTLASDTDAVIRIPSLRRSPRPVSAARAARGLIVLIRERSPQIVHTHLAMAGALGRWAANRAGVPVVVHTYHGHVLDGYFPAPVARAFVVAERHLARRSDALLSVSEAARDELLALGIGRPSQWHVVPVGLDLSGLLSAALSTVEARARLGLPADDGPVVGIVGRLAAVKDHETFLEVAARVAAHVPEARFVVAGDGELRLALEARAEALLGDRIRFLGWAHDLPVLYRALDVVALTSRHEGTPVALIEAAAAGRPVVATAVGGVPEVVQDGRTGLLAPAGDVTRLAGGIVTLLRDRERAAAFGATGRAWVAPRFTIDRLADDLAALYEELLARVRVPR